MTQLDLRERELLVRGEELEFQRMKLVLDFARFGFTGTLTAALVGAALIFALATLSAVTTYRIDDRVLLGLGVIVFLGAATFGYLSLGVAPTVAAKIGKQLGFEIGPVKKG